MTTTSVNNDVERLDAHHDEETFKYQEATTKAAKGIRKLDKIGDTKRGEDGNTTVTRHPHNSIDQEVKIPDKVSTWLEQIDEKNMRDSSGTHFYESHKLDENERVRLEAILRHCLKDEPDEKNNIPGFKLEDAINFKSSDRSHKKLTAWKGRKSDGKFVEGIHKRMKH